MDSRDRVLKPIRQVVSPLKGSLEDLVRLVSATPKPVHLVSRLGIDKSLASRLVKTIECADTLESLAHCPSPQGLRMFVRAVSKFGARRSKLAAAEDAIDDFENLVDSLPGGRSGLLALVSDSVPVVKARNERSAKQAMFKAGSQLLGYQSRALLTTHVVWPCHCGEHTDRVVLGWSSGLRRLHTKHSLPYFGGHTSANSVETLSGQSAGSDPYHYVLHEFSDTPLPEFRVVRNGNTVLFVLDSNQPPLREETSIAFGYVHRCGSPRFKTEDSAHLRLSVTPRIPTETAIHDVLVHKSIAESMPWTVGARRPGYASISTSPEVTEFDALDLDLESVAYDGAPALPMPAGFARYGALLNYVMKRIDHDAENFQTYRLSIGYPPPFVMLCQWFQLPEP